MCIITDSSSIPSKSVSNHIVGGVGIAVLAAVLAVVVALLVVLLEEVLLVAVAVLA